MRTPSARGPMAVHRNVAILYGIVAFAVLVGCGGGSGYHPPVTATAPPSGTGATSAASAAASASAAAASPTPTPTASPTPIPLTASPASVAFGGVNGSQQVTVTEKAFTGTFTAVSNDTSIVTVAPASIAVSATGSPASTGAFVLTSIGIGTNASGATTITVSDGKITIGVPVTVSVTSGNITYWAPSLVRLHS